MKKSGMKRLLSMALAACLVLGLLPAMAFAAEESVAMIKRTGVGYASIRAAVEAAQDGDTVVVVKDHEINCADNPNELRSGYFSLINVNGKSVTIDLNGKSLTGTVNFSNGKFILFSSLNGGHLILKDSDGSGSVNLTDTSSDILTESSVYSLMMAYTDSYLTVESGSYELNKSADNLLYSSGNEKVVINGGNFRLGNVASKGSSGNYSPWIFNVSGQGEKHLTVYGGTFNYDVFHQHYLFEVQFPKNKGLRQIDGTDTWTVFDGAVIVRHQDATDKFYNRYTGYETLEKAVAAVRPIRTKNSDTSDPEDVVLLTDCSVTDTLQINESFTLFLKDPDDPAAQRNTIIWEGEQDKPLITVAGEKELKIEDFVPKRKGYVFYGWYTDAALQKPYDLAHVSKVPGGTSLYAKWELGNYDIHWMNDGVPFVQDTAQNFGEKLVLPVDQPTKAAEGRYTYTFAGWFTAETGGEQVTAETVFNTGEETTYYAQYTRSEKGNLPALKRPADEEAVSTVPVFLAPVQDQTVIACVGDTAAMEVSVQDAETYQWYVDRNDGQGFVPIPGAESSGYTTASVVLRNDGYRYYCAAENAFGTAVSPIFMLQVVETLGVPKTGSNSPLSLYIGLALMSIAGIVAAAAGRKER